MKIRNKLTLLFSLVGMGIFLAFSCTLYFFTSEYRKNEFNNRLKQRVEITEKIFLESDNSPDFKAIQEQFLNKLPEETEEVVELIPQFKDQLQINYPPDFLPALLTDKETFFQEDSRQGAGRIFHVNGKDYVVLLTAVDHVGIRMMDHLITILVVVMTICFVTLVSLSYLVSGYLLNPISLKIRKANSISANNLHERLNVINPEDEMGQLALAFNGLLNRVEQAFYTQKLFIDNASHEIRNPLTAIMGEAEVALEKPREKEEYMNSIKSISIEADRLNVLVNDLIQLAGISQKDVSFSRELISTHELLIQAREKLALKYPHEEIQINLPVPDSVEVHVEGNRHLLVTAFFNLLDNAVKFSGFKVINVTIHTRNDTKIEISIQDDGIGIPPKDLENITHPFHRASNVRSIKGTGIGMPLTLRIIELHGGTLSVKSTLHSGTTATVKLPMTSLKF
jgi:signal transduction histidine kinase